MPENRLAKIRPVGSHANAKKLVPGERFGKLVVVSMSQALEGKRALAWMCRCDCGQMVCRQGTVLRSRRSTSCGCQKQARTPARHAANLAQVRPDSILRSIYVTYLKEATKRGLAFELSRDEFIALSKQDCYYCGQPPKLIQRTEYISVQRNGLDRVDNNAGYTASNCVPCCGTCNFMKASRGVDDFLAQVARIYTHSSMRSYARA